VFAFITVECGRPLLRNSALALGTAVALALLSEFLYVQFPLGYLPDLVWLPTWLR
jgi:hypothetical protein